MIDVYQTVTDRIIATLEAGRITWRQEWKAQKAADFMLLRSAAQLAEGEEIAA